MKIGSKYEEWYEKNIDELEIKFKESGAWYELDFNLEDEIDKEWDYYCQKICLNYHNKEHTT